MRKRILLLTFALAGLLAAPAARGQGYTDALLTSINQNTDFPCGNGADSDTANIQQAIKAAAHFGGGTVDLTCYQGPISITADIFSGVSAKILLYLPEHAVTVTVASTIPSNFEICGGPGSSISGGSLTNNAAACFNGFTGGGGTPGGADGTVQYNHGGAFDGIMHSSVDPTTGNLTLGADFNVLATSNNPNGIAITGNGPLYLESRGSGGIFIDGRGTDIGGGGTSAVNIKGADGTAIFEFSAVGILIDSTGLGSTGTGPLALTSAGGVPISDNSGSGVSITESGASTALNVTGLDPAHPALNVNAGGGANYLTATTTDANGTAVGAYLQGVWTDTTGNGGFTAGFQARTYLGGSNVTSDNAYGGVISFNENWTAGNPQQTVDLFLENNVVADIGLVPAERFGIFITDMSQTVPASVTNGAIVTSNQTPGPTVWTFKGGTGTYLFGDWTTPGIDTLANLTTQSAALIGEGYTKLCSDCDTPVAEGDVCTTGGDGAGAQVLYIRGALHCY